MVTLHILLSHLNGRLVLYFNNPQDRNGWIDFNEFIIATHCSATSSPADKLHWVFQMYDKDKSQTIQLGEMVELFGTLYLNEGLEMDAAVERAMAIFATLDVDNDGDVTEDEFVRGCLEVSKEFSFASCHLYYRATRIGKKYRSVQFFGKFVLCSKVILWLTGLTHFRANFPFGIILNYWHCALKFNIS